MSMPLASEAGWQRHRTGSLLMAAGLAALVLYLLSPALTAVHVEGFTAQIQLGAIAANAGLIDRANLVFPLQFEYFYLTKLGVVLLLQAMMRISGSTGDGVFRVLTALSFVLFVISTLAISRRHSRAGLLASGAALLLTPGLAELAFYFNDNVVSAASGMLGIALLPRPGGTAAGSRRRVARGLLSGAALGFAIVCRTDAVLLLPVLAGFAWLEARRWPELILPGALVSAGILAAFAASYAISDTTVLQALQVARFFDGLHGGLRSKRTLAPAFFLFFGLPMLALLPISVAQGWREGTVKQALVLIVLPLLLLAYMVLHALETRQFYPLLAPFIAIHGGRGLQRLRGALATRRGPAFWAAAAWVAGTAFVWLAPPVLVPVKEGPRAVAGRMWSPLLWFQWQASVEANLDDIAALVDAADRLPRVAVIATEFSPDYYLRLRLWERGYRAVRAEEAVPGCVGGFEAWRRDGHELVLVRTENPHLMIRQPLDYLAALQLQRAFACPALFEATPTYVSDQGFHARDDEIMAFLVAMRPELTPTAITFGWPRDAARDVRRALSRLPIGHEASLNHTAPLTAEQLAGLSRVADRVVASRADIAHGPAPDYDQFVAAFGRKFLPAREPDGR